jgi:3-oxoacyl-[acyl-carrier protein] reductase
MNLKGKVAIVTGGNSGIGRAIATALARAGADLSVAARRARETETAAFELRQRFGCKTLAIRADVSREADCERLVHETLAHLGRVDILVNNAGIYAGGRIADTTTEEFDRVLKTNLYGTFWCCRAAFPIMAKMGGGYIINISSLAGKEAWAETGPYSASKFGIMALTQALADEGKPHNIKCTAICPALVATPMTGVSGPEFLQPEDVAETVLYLLKLSPAAWPLEVVLPRKAAQ